MSTVEDKFKVAVEHIQNTPPSSAVTQDMQLKMYGLFKQATEGNVQGKQPGMLQIVKRAKYNAWAANKGMSKEDAMQAYVKEVEDAIGDLSAMLKSE